MSHRTVVVTAVVTACVTVAVSQVVGAVAADPPTTQVDGCVAAQTGALRVLTEARPTCEESETPLSWNEGQLATRWYRDHDKDGFGDWYQSIDSPTQPVGFVDNNDDCNDNELTTSPAVDVDEGPGDRDCNGLAADDRLVTVYVDRDGDGYGTVRNGEAPMSAIPPGYSPHNGDCNDRSVKITPYTQRGCGGPIVRDRDSDGMRATAAGGDDCNDYDRNQYRGNTERLDAYGHDEDCDPSTGFVIGYDPQWYDPRPHPLSYRGQTWFDTGGRRVGGVVPVRGRLWTSAPGQHEFYVPNETSWPLVVPGP